MEKKYQSLTLFEFQQQFSDDKACFEHLAKLKWPNGFVCEKCGYNHSCRGKLERTRQCTKCGYQATPTSNTLFHKLKFPIVKAFYIVYFVATNKQGVSSTELSRKLGLRQKTCWSFKQKVMKAMKSSQQFPLLGKVEVDEMVVGQQEEGIKGRQLGKKKLVLVAIKRNGKGVDRMYARVVKNASNKSVEPFFIDHIDPSADVKTDKWKGYDALSKQYPKLRQVSSGRKGTNFPDMHRVIMMFKAWLRGTHHSVKHLQGYLDEYCYRFNRSLMKEDIFDNLLNRMVLHRPVYYKNFTIY